jgi:hypothetical protein
VLGNDSTKAIIDTEKSINLSSRLYFVFIYLVIGCWTLFCSSVKKNGC